MEKNKILQQAKDYLTDQLTYGNLIFPVYSEVKADANEGIHPRNNMQIVSDEEFKPIENDKSDVFAVDSDWKKSTNLNELKLQIEECQNCPLGLTRKSFVFGSGNPKADIMIIGEAPGADEDEQGLPFVGKAGQLLTKILEAINISREEVFIANILKCRPPNNRAPLQSETDECEPYLMKQIELINPAFILVLGLTAANTLLRAKLKMGESSGQLMDYHGRKLMITYHPAALLRNPALKKPVWEHVQILKKLYDEYLIDNNKRVIE